MCIERQRGSREIIDHRPTDNPLSTGLTTLLACSDDAATREWIVDRLLELGKDPESPARFEEVDLERAIAGIDAGMRPEEYWLGW